LACCRWYYSRVQVPNFIVV